MVNQVLVETLKARRDIRRFLLYFIGPKQPYGLTSRQGDEEGGVLCVPGKAARNI